MDDDLIAELIKTLKNDDADPKKLTQEQIKRLVKRTEQVTDEHIRKIQAAGAEAVKDFPGATESNSWNSKGTYSYDPDHANVEFFLEHLSDEKFQTKVLKYLVDKLAKDNKEGVWNDRNTLKLSDLLPKKALEARRKAGQKAFEEVEKRVDKAVKAVEKDRDTIIDAAVFYKSEHIIDVLNEFEKKEYSV